MTSSKTVQVAETLALTDPRVREALSDPRAKLPDDSFAFRSMQATLRGVGDWVPDLAAAWVTRLFVTPQRFDTPPRERAWEIEARRSVVDTAAGLVHTYSWPRASMPWERPAKHRAVLLHGWQGRGTQMCAFIDVLHDAGCDVVAIDGPAHGASPGTRADAGRFALALRDVVAAIGGADVVVAHSMGAGATVLALNDGMPVRAAVLISPPSSAEQIADDFSASLGLSKKMDAAFRRRIEQVFHPYMWNKLQIEKMAAQLTHVAGLIVHDVDDGEVPFARGAAVHAAWPGSTLLATKGLGHRRVLRDPIVLRAVHAHVVKSLELPL
jgi:pimeloyl-ACP methyl ester carboxylesterase